MNIRKIIREEIQNILNEAKKIGDDIKTIKGVSIGIVVKIGKYRNKPLYILKSAKNKYKILSGNAAYDIGNLKQAEDEFNKLIDGHYD